MAEVTAATAAGITGTVVPLIGVGLVAGLALHTTKQIERMYQQNRRQQYRYPKPSTKSRKPTYNTFPKRDKYQNPYAWRR